MRVTYCDNIFVGLRAAEKLYRTNKPTSLPQWQFNVERIVVRDSSPRLNNARYTARSASKYKTSSFPWLQSDLCNGVRTLRGPRRSKDRSLDR